MGCQTEIEHASPASGGKTLQRILWAAINNSWSSWKGALWTDRVGSLQIYDCILEAAGYPQPRARACRQVGGPRKPHCKRTVGPRAVTLGTSRAIGQMISFPSLCYCCFRCQKKNLRFIEMWVCFLTVIQAWYQRHWEKLLLRWIKLPATQHAQQLVSDELYRGEDCLPICLLLTSFSHFALHSSVSWLSYSPFLSFSFFPSLPPHNVAMKTSFFYIVLSKFPYFWGS